MAKKEKANFSPQPSQLLSASVGIHWRGFDCDFSDWLFFPAIDMQRDYLPEEIKKQLKEKHCGDLIRHSFCAEELLDRPSEALKLKIPTDYFQPHNNDTGSEQPRIGRFYPANSFHKSGSVHLPAERPGRVTKITDRFVRVDFNHPLAGRKIDFSLHIHDFKAACAEHDGRCINIVADSCNTGSGMQDRLGSTDTDFFSRQAFSRLDDHDDTVYFTQPCFSPYWDQRASQQVSDYYAQHIAPQSHVLDLMSGAHSPLQEADIDLAGVTCAGLNRQELERNKISSHIEVLDVNRISSLPFPNAGFDAVLIHAAIEYVVQPRLLINEIGRVMKPGGKFIISFSNRNESKKAIHLWSNVYEFERPGIVLSYLRRDGGFSNFQSYSQRGFFRSRDDQRWPDLPYSDPVFIIMAEKSVDQLP